MSDFCEIFFVSMIVIHYNELKYLHFNLVDLLFKCRTSFDHIF